MANKLIKIDIDGVLRDILSNMISLYNVGLDQNISLSDVTDYDVDKVFTACEVAGKKASDYFFDENAEMIYLHSPVCNKAVTCLNIIKQLGYDIVLCSRQDSYKAKKYTLEWLENNKIPYDAIYFGKDKSVVKADIFVDDYPVNFLSDNSEMQFCINMPYNEETNISGFHRIYDLPDLVYMILKQ